MLPVRLAASELSTELVPAADAAAAAAFALLLSVSTGTTMSVVSPVELSKMLRRISLSVRSKEIFWSPTVNSPEVPGSEPVMASTTLEDNADSKRLWI